MNRDELLAVNGKMNTYTGVLFNLMDPDPKDIHIEDIAHGLAHNARWNGATKSFYSIAEHSLRVSAHGKSIDEALSGLFHDAEEAYWGDIIYPVKEILKVVAPEITNKMVDLRKMIYDRFNIPFINIKEYDLLELEWEYQNMIISNRHKPMTPAAAEHAWKVKLCELAEQFERVYVYGRLKIITR